MTEVPSTCYQPIENYGVIGDLHTIALVGMDGSIDFLSFPHFDSPTVLPPSSIVSAVAASRSPRALWMRDRSNFYLPDSNILLTRFLSDEG